MSGSTGLGPREAEEVLARVRRVVEERRRAGSPAPPPQALEPTAPVEGSDFFPWRRPVPGAPPVAPSLAVNDLIELSPARCVTRVFHALLGRSPSPAERTAWEGRVARQVWQRLVLLAALRLGAEGRARGVRLRVRWGPLWRTGVAYLKVRLRARRWRP